MEVPVVYLFIVLAFFIIVSIMYVVHISVHLSRLKKYLNNFYKDIKEKEDRGFEIRPDYILDYIQEMLEKFIYM